ncbi:MAG: LacI family transcriptional regulator [Gaiellales bacterium]|jgi:LacI family transcriptional regulator|nr:LacI family transcriptional regulator [Gaiellales bacterium]MDX6621253.1 LacI family transcriptional regulator [Gaiellales bacterium]
MREVAALADVSVKTVSRVVNGERTVDADLARRVREAIGMLGYRRDDAARALRRADRVSSSIGLVFEDVANPFLSYVHRAIEDVARARGVLTFAASADERPELERELALAFCARRIDGLIIAPAGTDHSYLARERDAGIALVFVDRPPAFLDADAVLSDNAAATTRAILGMAKRGHRRIGFLSDRAELYTAKARLQGYRDALSALGIAEEPALVRANVANPASADAAVRELFALPEPPTALFTGQNLITAATLHTLRALGLHTSIALIGFDDFELADLLDPPVSVVAQNVAELGRTAAELLFARIDGDTSPSKRVVIPTTLIERGSGEIAP